MPAPDAYSSLVPQRADRYGDPNKVIRDASLSLVVPDHQPIVPIGDPGKGWREVSIGERVKSHFEFYSFSSPIGWRLTDFWTGELENGKRIMVTGRTHYREPRSVAAWARVLPALASKYWRRLTRRTS